MKMEILLVGEFNLDIPNNLKEIKMVPYNTPPGTYLVAISNTRDEKFTEYMMPLLIIGKTYILHSIVDCILDVDISKDHYCVFLCETLEFHERYYDLTNIITGKEYSIRLGYIPNDLKIKELSQEIEKLLTIKNTLSISSKILEEV
jgi:hypothetical protein